MRMDIGPYIGLTVWALLILVLSDPCPLGFAIILTTGHIYSYTIPGPPKYLKQQPICRVPIRLGLRLFCWALWIPYLGPWAPVGTGQDTASSAKAPALAH